MAADQEPENMFSDSIKRLLAEAEEKQASMIMLGVLSMCPDCRRPYPAKLERCPDCIGEKRKGYKQINDEVGVPAKYREARKGTFSADQVKIMADFSTGLIDSLFICGNQGTGKTFLATATLQAFARAQENKTALWTTAGMMLAAIRATYHAQAKEQELAVMHKFSECGCLLIDDMGAEKVSDWSIPMMYEIIASRTNWNRPTIITSNLTVAQIAEWNPRIASRLAGGVVYRMDGADRRMAK